MENLSHSFSKRSYAGNGFGTATHKSVYDDVFGGPPKFGMPTLAPRLEDYSEIFGGFHSARGSSIPILDLPVVDEAELAFDVRSSRFDYSEVFGGFDGLDFALSLDDFVRKSNGRDESSDDDAWSPAESESPSGDTDPSAFSDRSQSLINEDIYHPTADIRQFDTSWDEANQRSNEKISNLATHEAQSHAIPGNGYVFEKNHILPKVEVQTSQADCDLKSSSDFYGGISEVKRTIFLPGKFDFRRQERDCSHVEKHRVPGPNQIKPFVTVNDINLKTRPSQLPPPSRPPPAYADKMGAFAKLNLRPKESRSFSLEETEANSSLPFYDVEIDGNSSTLASPTVRDAMEKARANVKGTRESMDKRLLRSCSMSQLQSSKKIVEENVNKTFDGISSCNDEKNLKYTEGSGVTGSVAEERGKSFKDQEVSNLVEPERDIDFVERSTKRRNGKDGGLSGQAFAWRQETEFFEVVEAGIPFEAIEQHQDETKFAQKGSNESRNWVVTGAFDQKDEVMGFKEAKEVPKLHEKKNKVEVAAEAYGDGMRSETVGESSSQIAFQKIATVCLKSSESDLNKKKIKMAKSPEEMIRLQNGSEKSRENQTKAGSKVLEANHNPRGIREKTGSKPMFNDSCAQKTNERKLKEDLVILEADERHSKADGQEEDKKTEIVLDVRKKPDECHEKQRNVNKHNEVFESKDNEKSFKGTENRKSQELDGPTMTFVEFDIEESSTITSVSTNSTPIEAFEHLEFGGCVKDTMQIKGDCKGGTEKLDQITHLTTGRESIKAFDETDKLNSDTHSAPSSGELDIGFEKVEANQAAISCEEDEDLKTNLKERDHVIDPRVTNYLVEERPRSANEDEFQHAKCENGSLGVKNCENDPNGAWIDIGNSSIKLDKEISKRPSEPDHSNIKAYEQGQRVKMTSGVQLDFSRRISQENLTSHQPCVELSENGKVTGATSTAMPRNREIHLSSDKNCIENVEEKNMHETITVENNEIEESLQRERELEKEHLRKIEEEREREREREKDRMAIDRATLEARDRLHIDARERAEKASVERTAAEVRQRAMAEAREKLEKSSLEARERYLMDKASTEARLRAERAAVERATLEARQRAFERAMAERFMAEGRERVERSVSDKFFTSSRTNELRQNSFPNAGTSNALRYSYSVHNGNESESPQRCKARLERYRRTAERAAKALQEKNLRDLVAQREQAERNRLAETLDAEVKRWSSGKEGNLRALLSTLQYILGPESGWQPIPLTEVITSAAVKKAYRKATLCVHPDKLQQRGASIQQKYVCEKVFDLLKDAWNTFNSEER